jgi:nucleoside-diphosphate-sugar epimerase
VVNNIKRALVTGAAGFIGSHLVDELLRRDWDVTGVDNFDSFYSPEIKWANIAEHLPSSQYRLIQADIRDLDALRMSLTGNYDVIVHLAAKAGVRPSIDDLSPTRKRTFVVPTTFWSSRASGKRHNSCSHPPAASTE